MKNRECKHQLEIQGLSKKYGSFFALRKVTLALTDGVYAILGPNGAGKSTLMKILTLTMNPTEGKVVYRGEEIGAQGKEFLKYLGYVPQQQPVYGGFTAEEFLYYAGTLKGLGKKDIKSQTKVLLEEMHLSDDAGKKVRQFSGGMKQRLLLAQSLLGNPEIVLLDEPTAGVDPIERMFIRKFIEKIGQDKIVIITTHIISDIESIADQLVLINKGEILYSGTRMGLLEKSGMSNVEEAYAHMFEGK